MTLARELLHQSEEAHLKAKRFRTEASAALGQPGPLGLAKACRLLVDVVRYESKSRELLAAAVLQDPQVLNDRSKRSE